MPYCITDFLNLTKPDEVQRIMELNAYISDFQSQLENMVEREKEQGNRWRMVRKSLLDRIESIRQILGSMEAILQLGSGDLSKRRTCQDVNTIERILF